MVFDCSSGLLERVSSEKNLTFSSKRISWAFKSLIACLAEVEKIEEVKEEPVSIIKKEVEIEKENVLLDNDPVTILVNTSKKNDTIIPMQMTISLPTKELFNIVSNNFDNGDEKFVDVILSQIKYDMFKVCLRDALLQAYKYEEEKIIE